MFKGKSELIPGRLSAMFKPNINESEAKIIIEQSGCKMYSFTKLVGIAEINCSAGQEPGAIRKLKANKQIISVERVIKHILH